MSTFDTLKRSSNYQTLSLISDRINVFCAISAYASAHLCYAIDDSVERFSDKTECGQVVQHVEHKATRARVSVRAANHHVPLRVHIAKLAP